MRKTFGKATVALAFSCSLLPSASGQTAADWVKRLDRAEARGKHVQIKALAEFQDRFKKHPDPELSRLAQSLIQELRAGDDPDFEPLKERLRLHAGLEAPPQEGVGATADEILGRPEFRDVEGREASNWLQRALARLGDLFTPKPRHSISELPSGSISLGWLFYAAAGLLALGALVLLFFAVRYFRWKSGAKLGRLQRTGLLGEDEPDRTLDEWLALAERLQAEGRLREVVRCLYLAILMRLDQARMIRFDRTQTNWEHLAKIHSSPAPREVGYKRLTHKFDVIWYGGKAASQDDCEDVRSQYKLLAERLKEAA